MLTGVKRVYAHHPPPASDNPHYVLPFDKYGDPPGDIYSCSKETVQEYPDGTSLIWMAWAKTNESMASLATWGPLTSASPEVVGA